MSKYLILDIISKAERQAESKRLAKQEQAERALWEKRMDRRSDFPLPLPYSMNKPHSDDNEYEDIHGRLEMQLILFEETLNKQRSYYC
ncbi:MAG: hypothetical protein MHMPM18_004057 [Marteilia pararefringens]